MITLAAYLAKMSTKADMSVKLEFETREFDNKDIAALMEFRDKEGWLLFSANKFADDVRIPDMTADSGKGEKTPSERMRGAMWHWWDQSGRPTTTFEEFYRMKMERMIDQIKEKLE